MSRRLSETLLATCLMVPVLVASGTARAEETDRHNRGAEIYEKWCAGCHADGVHYAGTMALQAKYKGAVPALLTERQDLSPEFIEVFVRNGFSIMPHFRKTLISDEELDALSHYLINGE